MSNYSDNPNACRVDFFKPSGKWYCTETVVFLNEDYNKHPMNAFTNALTNHFGNTNRLIGMQAVCLEPYVANAFPLMMAV